MSINLKNCSGQICAAPISKKAQYRNPIFDSNIEKSFSYISNNTANVNFQVVQQLKFIGVD